MQLYANFTIPRRNIINPPHCLNSSDAGEHKFAYCNSMRLHYVESGAADLPVLLFIHGVPDTWYSWQNQLSQLKTQYRALAVDLRGCGESSRPVGVHNMKTSLLIDDIRALAHELGIGKFTLVAPDAVSGSIAYHYAATYPDTLDALVVCDTPHPEIWMDQQVFFSR